MEFILKVPNSQVCIKIVRINNQTILISFRWFLDYHLLGSYKSPGDVNGTMMTILLSTEMVYHRKLYLLLLLLLFELIKSSLCLPVCRTVHKKYAIQHYMVVPYHHAYHVANWPYQMVWNGTHRYHLGTGYHERVKVFQYFSWRIQGWYLISFIQNELYVYVSNSYFKFTFFIQVVDFLQFSFLQKNRTFMINDISAFMEIAKLQAAVLVSDNHLVNKHYRYLFWAIL